MLDTLLLRPSLPFTTLHRTTLHSTSIHFTELHLTPLQYTCRHFTSSHLNFTHLHFTSLSFGVIFSLNYPLNMRDKLISFTKFNAQFLYSLTICMLHYNPRHVSSINMPIFRMTNCIITASGIVTLCTAVYRK